jgi:nicotinamidase/pyrazinamidase
MVTKLLIIDPQVDFCDKAGALCVPGAKADMRRLAYLLGQMGSRVDTVYVTLDTHHLLHIAHPAFWQNAQGQQPPVFTTITLKDVQSGQWRIAKQDVTLQQVLTYLKQLEGHKFQLTVWPEHCLLGSVGHTVESVLAEALKTWQRIQKRDVIYVPKGYNSLTEHYSALVAAVPHKDDQTTQFNAGLAQELRSSDRLLVAGEALSHCVIATLRDLCQGLTVVECQKFTLLTDGCSCVEGFEEQRNALLQEVLGFGVRLATMDEVMNE